MSVFTVAVSMICTCLRLVCSGSGIAYCAKAWFGEPRPHHISSFPSLYVFFALFLSFSVSLSRPEPCARCICGCPTLRAIAFIPW